MSAFDDHLDRGRGYVRHEMWDDAIAELESALCILPDSVSAKLVFVEALLGRWKATDFPPDKMRGRELAQECADAGSDEARLLLITLRDPQIEEPGPGAPALDTTPVTPMSDATRVRIAFVITTIVMVGGWIAVDSATQTQPAIPVYSPPEIPPIEIVTPEPLVMPAIPAKQDRELVVTFDPGVASANLDFAPRTSHLDVYPERAFYRLSGDLQVVGNVEITEVEGRLDILRESQVIESHSWFLWASHEAVLRPGDHGTIARVFRAAGDADAARVVVEKVSERLAPSSYPQTSIIEPIWVVPRPEGVEIEISERFARLDRYDLTNSAYFVANWEFHNVGTEPLAHLKYELRLLDAHGKLLDSQMRLATYSSNPPIEPGETRLESAIRSVSPTYDHYRMAVVEVKRGDPQLLE